jgi:hypothetical protein
MLPFDTNQFRIKRFLDIDPEALKIEENSLCFLDWEIELYPYSSISTPQIVLLPYLLNLEAS